MDQDGWPLVNRFGARTMIGEELFVWALACYGITFLICDAVIFARPRAWLMRRFEFIAELLSCYFCTGFWVSLVSATWLLGWTPALVFYGFAGATVCYFVDAAIRRLENGHDDTSGVA